MKGLNKLVLMLVTSILITVISTQVYGKVESSETLNGFNVTWYNCYFGLTQHFCYVNIQNLDSSVARDFNLQLLFSNTSYSVEKTNATINEWKSQLTEIPTYGKQLISKTCSDNNVTFYDCSYNTTYQNGTTIKNIAQWKPTKMFLTKGNSKAIGNYGLINIPKFGSKEKYDDNNITETKNGTKTFKVEWITPIEISGNGWGAKGLIAFVDENTNTTYHPWYNQSFKSCANFTIKNTHLATKFHGFYFFNFTGLTDKQADSDDVRIVNAGCNDGGSEVRYNVYTNTSTSIYALIELEISANININYSIYWNNSDASKPAYSSSLRYESINNNRRYIENEYYNYTFNNASSLAMYSQYDQNYLKAYSNTTWLGRFGDMNGFVGSYTGCSLAVTFNDTLMVEFTTTCNEGKSIQRFYANYTWIESTINITSNNVNATLTWGHPRPDGRTLTTRAWWDGVSVQYNSSSDVGWIWMGANISDGWFIIYNTSSGNVNTVAGIAWNQSNVITSLGGDAKSWSTDDSVAEGHYFCLGCNASIDFIKNATVWNGIYQNKSGENIWTQTEIMNNLTEAPLQFTQGALQNSNIAPSIQRLIVEATGINSAIEIRLRVNASDTNGQSDIDSCFLNAIRGTFSNGICTIDISNELNNTGTIWVNDTLNLNTSQTFNFQINVSIFEQNTTAGRNFTIQAIKRNITIANRDSSNTLNIEVNQSNPLGYTGAFVVNLTDSLSSNTLVTNISRWSGDFVNDTKLTLERQDLVQTTEAGNQTYTNFTFEVVDYLGINWTGLNITAYCRSSWTQNTTFINLSSNLNISRQIGCNNTNIITRTSLRYNVTDSLVTIGLNSTGFLEVRVNNTDTSINYTSIRVNISSFVPSRWQLNQTIDENYTVDLNATNATVANTTLITPRPLIIEQATTLYTSECVGFTLFTNYCYQATTQEDGRTLYEIRTFIWINDTVVNNKPLYYYQPISRFVDWATRSTGTENVSVNSSYTNLTISSNGTHILTFVDTSHSTSSLSNISYYNVYATYYTPAAGQGEQGVGGGGGGGGGGKVITVTPLVSNITVVPEKGYKIPVGRGDNLTFEIMLLNPDVNNQTMDLTFEHIFLQTRNWFVFQKDGYTYSQLSVVIPGGSKVRPGQSIIKILVNIPVDAENREYLTNIIVSKDNTRLALIPITLLVGEKLLIFQIMDLLFTTPIYELPNPAMGVTHLSTGMLTIPIMFLITYSFVRKTWKWGKK